MVETAHCTAAIVSSGIEFRQSGMLPAKRLKLMQMGDLQDHKDGADERVDVLRAYGILDTPPDPSFDGIVQLAGQMCGTPVALVSLVDADRQWFKARVGFPHCETDLDRSVCRYVVRDAAPIVIPDLTADPRTRDNPLVTGDPFIRFYAGAPLIATSGHVLGALCVIDQVPRPEGLTDVQMTALTTLARQTVEVIELRRSVREHEDAINECERVRVAQADADHRWQTMFQSLHEGFILGRLIRDEVGRVTDWRYEAVNAAWSELVGVPRDDALGRTIREVFPGIEDEWVMEFADVVATGEATRFTRRVGVLDRWYDGVCQPVDAETFSVLFIEVTDRILATRRREALLRLGDELRDCDDVDAMHWSATSILGETLGVSRVAYGDMDHATATVDVLAGWALPDMPAIEGHYTFADYGDLYPGLMRGEPLVIADVEKDARTASDLSGWQALRARSVVNMPVIERDRTVAIVIVHHAVPHDWTEDELAFIRNVADRLQIGIARLRAEEGQAVLNAEIAHRLKNSLAMVQAIATQTFKGTVEPQKVRAFSQRLQTLGTAHDVLLARNVQAADLSELIARVLGTAGAGGRYDANGPSVRLGSRAALSSSLLFHELATNAVKYGALSVEGGRIAIDWQVEGKGEAAEIVLKWSERGGPPAQEPTRKGFGSRLLALGMTGTGGSTLRYDVDGFTAEFRARERQVEEA